MKLSSSDSKEQDSSELEREDRGFEDEDILRVGEPSGVSLLLRSFQVWQGPKKRIGLWANLMTKRSVQGGMNDWKLDCIANWSTVSKS